MKMQRPRGFTLVELLVAVGITAILAAALLSLVTQTLSLWNRSASALDLENQAGLVMDRIVTDLESAVVRSRLGFGWLRLEEGSNGTAALSVFTQVATTSTDEDDPNTVREATYKAIPDGPLVRLMRWEGTAAAALNFRYAFGSWPDTVLNEYLLAENLLRFEVGFYDASRNVMTEFTAANWPALAKVELEFITPDGAARLMASEAGNANEPREQIIAETRRVFVRWVEVGGYPW
ncbi:MAG: hypothetical protein SynsKO_26110 [Synoicihabitans sp.]